MLLKVQQGTGMWIKYLKGMCVGIILCFTNSSYAGLPELIKKMNTDTLTWRVHVVDKQGHPVPAPIVWRLIPNSRPYINKELMERLVRRYASDADFVQHEVHPNLMVDYADKEGLFIDTDSVTYHKSSNITTIYAVIKRGYLPTIVSDIAHKNTTHDVTISLNIDETAHINPQMLQFDLLRAQAHIPAASGQEIMQEERRQILLKTQQELRSLAQELERTKQYDLASAVYYNLAYLPSVDTIQKPDGTAMIIGYTNGYSAEKPQRRTDREKAMDLNKSNPNLIMHSFEKEIGVTSKNYFQYSSIQRKQYIEYVEKLIGQYGEKLWPIVMGSIIYQYQGEGMYAQACSSLNRAYRFEPTYKNMENWQNILNSLNHDALKAGYQGEPCTLSRPPYQ